MSEDYVGLFRKGEELEIAKFLDGLGDFNKFLKPFKLSVLGINISGWIGKKLEKNDRDIFLWFIQWLDNKIIAKKVSSDTTNVLKKIKGFILVKDIDGLIQYVSESLPAKLNILPSDTAEELAIKGILTTVYSLVKVQTEKIYDFFNEKVEIAEDEDKKIPTKGPIDDEPEGPDLPPKK
jgi:hypothetical protein